MFPYIYRCTHTVPFSPYQISRAQLKAWWDAERSDLVTVTGAGVSSWKDNIGGFDLVQGTNGNRPPYSATSFNGRPGVTFSIASSTYLRLSGVPSAFPTAANPGEIWAVIDQATPASSTTVCTIFRYGATTTAATRSMRRDSVAAVNRLNAVAELGSTEGTVDFTGRHIVRGIFSGADVVSEIDGVQAAATVAAANTGTSNVTMGATTAASPALFFGGTVHAIFVFAGLLDARTAYQLRNYYSGRL